MKPANKILLIIAVILVLAASITGTLAPGYWLLIPSLLAAGAILATLMIGVNRYYRDVEHEIELDDTTHFGSQGDAAIVLVGRLQKPVIKAIDYAIAAKHDKTLAVHVSVDPESTDHLQTEWFEHRVPVPLVIVDSPYRTFAHPVREFIQAYRKKYGSAVITVYLPQYIVGHWWESFLHNRRASRIAHDLMLVHGVTITLVPWLLDSTEIIYGRRSRPLPGGDRTGLPREASERIARRSLEE